MPDDPDVKHALIDATRHLYQVLWVADDLMPQQPLKNWLLSYKTEQFLEEAFFRCGNPLAAAWISRELEALRNWKASLPAYGV